MTVYIDEAYRCYAQDEEGRTAIEHAFFDGKCDALIETYRLVPHGCSWVREDGAVFGGEMIVPCRDPEAGLAAQAEYEKTAAQAPQCAAAYQEGVQDA